MLSRRGCDLLNPRSTFAGSVSAITARERQGCANGRFDEVRKQRPHTRARRSVIEVTRKAVGSKINSQLLLQ
jgi:hypothetical protein